MSHSIGHHAHPIPASDQATHRQPRIHLVTGPVGAGKSTFARRLCQQHNAVALNLDDWMARLFLPDRPAANVMDWYMERTQRCIDQICKASESIVACGIDVVLEIGLIRRSEREAFYGRLGPQSRRLLLYVLDAPRDIRRERVEQRNSRRGETFSMEVPAHIFELASDLWEPPCAIECAEREVVHVSVP